MTDYILETKKLTKDFKGFTAVSEVNLRVSRGKIHALIGPNGAGKTTVFNLTSPGRNRRRSPCAVWSAPSRSRRSFPT